MHKSIRKTAGLVVLLIAAQFFGSSPTLAASSNPQSVSASRNNTNGIISISWSAPSTSDDLVGYKVIVDSSGSGKTVSQLVNSTSVLSAKICYPFTGQTKVFVASVTTARTNPTLANPSSPESYWTVYSLGALGNVSGTACASSTTTAYSYTVVFNKNADTATATMETITGTAFAVVLPSNAFLYTDYSFTGWAETPSGAKQYNDGASITLTSAWNVTLYAVWVSNAAASSFNILYNDGGGSGPDPSSPLTVNRSETFTVPSNSYTKSGYRFAYWSSGSDTFTAGSTYPKTGTVTSGPVTLTANWLANKYTYDSNTATAGTNIADQVYAGTQLTAASNTYTAPAGYEFDGWCTVRLAVGTSTCTGGSKYAAGADIPDPSDPIVTLYAVWKTPAPAGGGGGGAAPAPVYVPKPPTITSISAPEVCAVTSQLTIKGTNLASASVKVEGVSARIVSANSSEIVAALPGSAVGTKTVTVTNDDGSATTTVKYVFQDTPIFVNYTYPETFKNKDFKYTFSADAATKYEISGTLPVGLALNSATGEITGAPAQEGNYVFTIVASNICDSSPLIVYMFVDKAIPSAFTCSVAFNNPRTDTISDIKLTNLKNCLSPIPSLSPKYVKPVIFLSGGIPAGLTADQALTHPRYLPIIGLIESMNLEAQIYYGAFSGSTDSVQLNVYWPDPS